MLTAAPPPLILRLLFRTVQDPRPRADKSLASADIYYPATALALPARPHSRVITNGVIFLPTAGMGAPVAINFRTCANPQTSLWAFIADALAPLATRPGSPRKC